MPLRPSTGDVARLTIVLGAVALVLATNLRDGPVPASGVAVGPLIFSDDFAGSSLDLSKWRPNWLAGSDTAITKPVNSAEKSCYDPAQVAVSEGSLRLTAVRRACTASNGVTYPYASGLVQSNSDFRFSYGYSEAKMFLPPNTDPGLGAVGSCGPNWPAFWTNGQSWPDHGEIDVMECLGDDACWHFHYSGGGAGDCVSAWQGGMPAGDAGWHTFGVDWKPGSLRFYYDGLPVGTQTTGVTASQHYLIAQLAISGTAIKVPQTLAIDYVRVWGRP